jgi:hypothetical protein
MTTTAMTEAELDELLDSAELPEETITLCLRTQLQRDFEAAEQRLAAALEDIEAADSLAAGSENLEGLAAEVERIRAAMAAASMTFTFQARDKDRWPALIAEHPAREGNELDSRYGLNFQSLMTALIQESTVKPKMTPARWSKVLSKITDGQWELLTTALWQLNRKAEVTVPFSRAASRILRNSAAVSKRLSGSDSL